MNTHIKPAISLNPYHPRNQREVKQLILDGLGEHWGTIDPSKNPDLDNICKYYRKDEFILALYKQQIIGSGVLVLLNSTTSKVVRMSVKKEFRRNGIGVSILDHLINIASIKGHTKVILETTTTWTEIIDFYTFYGFKITHHENDDTYFEYIIHE